MRTAWLLVILGLLCASASQAQAPAGEGSSEVRENSSETAEATAALLSDTASGELPNDVTAGGECQQPGSGGSDTQPAEAVAEEAVCAAAETTLAASEQPSQEQEAAAPDLAAAQQATEADQLEQPPEEVSPAPPEPPEAPPADQHHDLKDFALLKDGGCSSSCRLPLLVSTGLQGSPLPRLQVPCCPPTRLAGWAHQASVAAPSLRLMPDLHTTTMTFTPRMLGPTNANTRHVPSCPSACLLPPARLPQVPRSWPPTKRAASPRPCWTTTATPS